MEHLQNNKNEVLQQMEKYTFDEPLNVAVIYEEIDDEELIVPVQKSTKDYIDNSLTHTTNNSTTTSEISLQENNIDRMQYTSVIESIMKSVEDNVLINDAYNHQQLLPSTLLDIEKECPIFNNNTYDQLLTSLDTLSVNLIQISQAGFKTNYFRSNQNLYDKAKKNYLFVKNKIFKASFNITANVILPQENNRSFLERFISGTESIARCKSLKYISKEIIEYLVLDLIKWTKHEIRRLNTRMSITHLNQDLKKNITAGNVQYPGNNGSEENMTNISNSRKRSLFPNSHWERQLCNNTDLLKPNIHNVCCSNSNNFNSEDSGLTLPKRSNQVELNCHNNISDKQFQLPSQNEHAKINRTTISLRSVSRDSGIESPICSNWQTNNPMEAMYDNATRSSIENVNMAPSTTSTNFMSSNTPYIPFKTYCNVCQKAAKDVCKGCESKFYCSLECQSVDWNVHKHFCILR